MNDPIREIINYASAKLYIVYGICKRYTENGETVLISRDADGQEIHVIIKRVK